MKYIYSYAIVEDHIQLEQLSSWSEALAVELEAGLGSQNLPFKIKEGISEYDTDKITTLGVVVSDTHQQCMRLLKERYEEALV